MNRPEVPERIVRCPGCGGDSVYAASNLFRPFCSARCKNSDFGAWASEGYRVATGTAPDDNSDSSTPPPH
ncbi:MAG: DNA gyrase inhibitor YacG [Burkholderiaceae bacterium]|nr:DNA gyrase inhibitor YacG [Burkholderiaceae bacterium]